MSSKTEFAVLLCWRCDNETINRMAENVGGWVCDTCGEITAYEYEDEVMYRVELKDGKWVPLEEATDE